MGPNWANQTLWTGDNLDIMRGRNLIYLDPPFNSNRDYAASVTHCADIHRSTALGLIPHYLT